MHVCMQEIWVEGAAVAFAQGHGDVRRYFWIKFTRVASSGARRRPTKSASSRQRPIAQEPPFIRAICPPPTAFLRDHIPSPPHLRPIYVPLCRLSIPLPRFPPLYIIRAARPPPSKNFNFTSTLPPHSSVSRAPSPQPLILPSPPLSPPPPPPRPLPSLSPFTPSQS